jgi:hypothetical protein
MNPRKSRIVLLAAIIAVCMQSGGGLADKQGGTAPQVPQVAVKDLAMERYNIARPDSTQWIFNGRGKCFPRRWSLTGFNGLNQISGPWQYAFHFDFVEKRSGIKILDNVYEVMDTNDPCGWNFRKGAPFCIVPQDDTWYPHAERRTGSFLKNFKTGTVSFGIETRTIVSARSGEVLQVISIENRDAAPLTLSLLPMQNGENTFAHHEGKVWHCLATDLATVKGQSLEWTIPPKTRQTHNFAIGWFDQGAERPSVYQPTLGERVKQADEDGETQIQQIAGRLPALQTSNRHLDQLYKRCISTLALSRWNREEFRNHPTWSVWGFMCMTAWDFSFTGDSLCLLDPSGERQIIKDVLGIGQMKGSYIDLQEPRLQTWILYIQDPFALRDLINSYIKITGDRSVLDDNPGGHTVYEWMKLWAAKLDTFAQRPDGLIDMGYGNEYLLELRTDGYDYVVPAVNGLAVEYFRWLAQLARERRDPDATKYAQRAEALNASLQSLWDEKAGWFDNLYDDGSRAPFFTMHLFDLLGTSVLSQHQRQAIAAHFVPGDFLAEMGIYAISKKDRVHWDRFDQDWGGGGCYIGTPLRTARYLYENGDAPHAWEVLNRTARLAGHFSYLPQSPAVDEPYEWKYGGLLNISSGAGLEAVWSGVFGLRPQPDGSLVVSPPPFNPEIGEATLAGFPFRQHRYDVELLAKGWKVFVDGKLWSQKSYGQRAIIPPWPSIRQLTY